MGEGARLLRLGEEAFKPSYFLASQRSLKNSVIGAHFGSHKWKLKDSD